MVLKKIEDRTYEGARGRVAVIVADFHQEMTNGMLQGLEEVFEQYGEVSWQVHRVPGAFEIPLMAQKLASMVQVGEEPALNPDPLSSLAEASEGQKKGETIPAEEGIFDVIVVLGCVVKGDTYHFELVANECARGCMDVMLRFDIPLVFEVLAPYTYEAGMKRSQGEFNHGKLAAFTALDWLKKLK
ncbi:MAG: 6,7-dimethyl-8-ribityllumazine synthase [Candidatus Gracilibacteria bacterium]|nr:6,7-dimethyl-8-ribityllumazine synthase [Candidatus Gracilibacteria bacterium]